MVFEALSNVQDLFFFTNDFNFTFMPPIVPGRKKVDNILLSYCQKYGVLIDISFAFPQIHQGRSSHRNIPRIDDNYNVQYLTRKGILADSPYQVLKYGDNLILLSYFVCFNHIFFAIFQNEKCFFHFVFKFSFVFCYNMQYSPTPVISSPRDTFSSDINSIAVPQFPGIAIPTQFDSALENPQFEFLDGTSQDVISVHDSTIEGTCYTMDSTKL